MAILGAPKHSREEVPGFPEEMKSPLIAIWPSGWPTPEFGCL